MNSGSRAWPTYLRAAAFLTPTTLAWFFAFTFLLPKVQQIWKDAGLTASTVQWIIDASSSLMHSAPYLFATVAVLLLLVEFLWPAWPRYRAAVVACVTLIFHTAVLSGITSIAVAACVAAPVLARLK
jgi:type II secretory pathway component PulF